MKQAKPEIKVEAKSMPLLTYKNLAIGLMAFIAWNFYKSYQAGVNPLAVLGLQKLIPGAAAGVDSGVDNAGSSVTNNSATISPGVPETIDRARPDGNASLDPSIEY